MIEFLMGERIGKACIDAWKHDDLHGRVCALIAVFSVAHTFASGAVGIVGALV